MRWVRCGRRLDRSDRSATRESVTPRKGPKTAPLLQTLTKTDLSAIKYYHFAEGEVAVFVVEDHNCTRCGLCVAFCPNECLYFARLPEDGGATRTMGVDAAESMSMNRVSGTGPVYVGLSDQSP